MKKVTAICCSVFLLLGITLNAQDTVNDPPQATVSDEPGNAFRRFEFGIRFMPTFSAFDMATSSGNNVKGQVTLGFGAGALLGFNFSDYFGVQAEVIYNSLSQKYKDQDLQREINVRYVNFPLLASLNTPESRAVSLNVVFGPQFGYNLGSSIVTSSSPVSDTVVTRLAINKNDFGFAYGAGLGFALNPSHSIRLDLGFRGVYGFVNISNTSITMNSRTVFILDRAIVKTYSGYLGLTFLF